MVDAMVKNFTTTEGGGGLRSKIKRFRACRCKFPLISKSLTKSKSKSTTKSLTKPNSKSLTNKEEMKMVIAVKTEEDGMESELQRPLSIPLTEEEDELTKKKKMKEVIKEEIDTTKGVPMN